MKKLVFLLALLFPKIAVAEAPVVASGADKIVVVSPVVTASSAYASGNQVGGVLVLPHLADTSDFTVTLLDAALLDTSNNVSIQYRVYFFDDVITPSSTDKTAFTISAADMLKCRGSVLLTPTVGGGSTFGVQGSVFQKIDSVSKTLGQRDGNIYAVITINGGAPTYSTTSALQLIVGVSL